MFMGVVLVFSALAILIFLVFFNENDILGPTIQQNTSIIFANQTNFKAIDGFSKEKIAETIFNQTNNTKVKMGEIEGIYLTENEQVVGFRRFVSLIKGNIILDKTDFINDNFLLGVFKSGLNPISPDVGDLFILLKIRSMADTFPVIRDWESKMLYDLYGFFGVNITPETNYLFTKNFEDGIVNNKNARILKDNDGKIVLMYVFINDLSIIITNSELATKEVILRFASSQIKK